MSETGGDEILVRFATEVESDATREGLKLLREALRRFAVVGGGGDAGDDVVALIEALIDNKVADALEAMSDRIEQASGVRP